MKKISVWARSNPRKAQALIVAGQFILVALALFIGFSFYCLNIAIPFWTLPFVISLFIAAIYFYPIKDISGQWNRGYKFRKRMDMCMVTLSFVICLIGFNQFCFEPISNASISESMNTPKASFIVLGEIPNTPKENKAGFFSKFKESRKSLKRALKVEVKKIKKNLRVNKQKGLPVVLQIFLMLLALIVAWVIFVAVAYISCGLSCSGSAGLAAAVLIGGLLGILTGLFFAFRAILRNGRHSKKNRNGSSNLSVA